ncbi:MAG: zinc-binding dehydrogenase [Thermoplasmata archaeon]
MSGSDAAVFRNPKDGFEIQHFPLPEVEPRGALVRVKMASICGTDLHIWHGVRKPPLPIIPGHEAMGVIEKLGASLTTDASGAPLHEGDRVTWSYIWTCGACYYCTILKEPASCARRMAYGVGVGCAEPPHLNGGFSEYIYLRPGTSIFKIPDSLSDAVVVPTNCALVTMVHVTRAAGVTLGQNVVVQGCGPLGLYGTTVARELGAGQVIALDTNENRLELARKFGVDRAINVAKMSDDEIVARVQELTGGIGADVVIEATGVPQVLGVGLRLPREGGTYATIGPIYQGATVALDCFNLIFRRIRLLGVARNDAGHLWTAIRFLERTQSKYPYDQVVGARFSLEQVTEALRTVDERKVMRAAVVP